MTATVPETPPLTPAVAIWSWFMAVTATPWNWLLNVGLTKVCPVRFSKSPAKELELLSLEDGTTFCTVTWFVGTMRCIVPVAALPFKPVMGMPFIALACELASWMTSGFPGLTPAMT